MKICFKDDPLCVSLLRGSLLLVCSTVVVACGEQSTSFTESTNVASDSQDRTGQGAITEGRSSDRSALPAAEGPLLELSGNWSDWTGGSTAIKYQPGAQSLLLPRADNGSDLVLGVKRFTRSLSAGTTYTLDASGSSAGTALQLYLRNRVGAQLAMRDNSSGRDVDYLRVAGGQRKSFVAPQGVSSIDLQVQSPWLAAKESNVKATLLALGEANPPSPAPTPVPGPNPTPAPAPIPAPAPTPAPLPGGDFRPAGYDRLLFSDEFNGGSLDRSIWCTRLPFGGGPVLQVPDGECTKFPGQGTLDFSNPDEQQRFRDFATGTNEPLHQFGNGALKIRATRTGRNDYQRFESGAIRSKPVFKPVDGTSYYISSRVKLPDVLGAWPAFYLISSIEPNGTSTWPPEIDIFEGPINGSKGENANTLWQHARIIGGQQTSSGQSEWTYGSPEFIVEWGFYRTTTSLRNRWLVIGAEWNENGVCYFINDLKTGCENYRWVTDSGQASNPATLIMYMAVGGWAGVNGVDDSAFPTQMEVDYIRVYERN